VVNYDLPNVPEDYVHRIGRTGRAGASGEAVSLVCVDEHIMLRDIERFIKRSLPKEVIPGFEPDPNAKAQPIQLRSGNAPGRRPQGRSGGAGGGGGNQRSQPRPQGSSQGKPHGGGTAANKPGSHKPSAPHRSGGRGR